MLNMVTKRKKIEDKLIILASDHNGFKLKNELNEYLTKIGYEVVDMGNVNMEAEDDYPDFAFRAGKKVVVGGARGVFVCGSGVGMSIAANKVKGVRAFNALSIKLAKMAKSDDDTNVICIGTRNVNIGLAKRIVKTWLGMKFNKKSKYKRRVEKIIQYEKNNTSNIK